MARAGPLVTGTGKSGGQSWPGPVHWSLVQVSLEVSHGLGHPLDLFLHGSLVVGMFLKEVPHLFLNLCYLDDHITKTSKAFHLNRLNLVIYQLIWKRHYLSCVSHDMIARESL